MLHPVIDPAIFALRPDFAALSIALRGAANGPSTAESEGRLAQAIAAMDHHRRFCRTLTVEDSHCESMLLDGRHEQADTRPLPHDELVRLHGFTSHTRVAVDLAGQGDDLARAA